MGLSIPLHLYVLKYTTTACCEMAGLPVFIKQNWARVLQGRMYLQVLVPVNWH